MGQLQNSLLMHVPLLHIKHIDIVPSYHKGLFVEERIRTTGCEFFHFNVVPYSVNGRNRGQLLLISVVSF